MNLQSQALEARRETHLSRGIDHLGFIESKLRDLQGFATLAHELMQNADDAEGTTFMCFNISDEALIVDNDGVFSGCEHVEEPICSWKEDPSKQHLCDFHRFRLVASADKRIEEGTTGAFGIGFIAVYQITDHPELISRGRHWILHDEDHEDKRIHVCHGCSRCSQHCLPGTRFFLPWATNPDSKIRKDLRAAPFSLEDRITFIEELESKLPVAMVFLKKLERIEIRENGKLRKRFERLVEGDQVLISDGNKENDRIWNIIEGDFEDAAKELKERNPNRIEQKRSYEVKIATPEKPSGGGLFCVCLPTEHDTGLPFHINADFFTSSDRKKLILETDYQSQWNYAAMEGAAEAMAAAFEKLRKLLGHKNLWELISSLHRVKQEADSGKRHRKLATFWEKVSPVLRESPIAYTESNRWVTPPEAYLLGDKEEEEALPVFEVLDLEIVHRDIRPYIFQLPRREVLGMEQLDLDHLIHSLQGKGFSVRQELSSLPEILQNQEGRDLLYREIICLLQRQRSPDKRRTLEEDLSNCAIALGRDGALWPCVEIYRANEKTISLFSAIDPHIPFLADMGEENEDIVKLCPRFSAKAAVACLEGFFERQDPVNHVQHVIDSKQLLDWFEARREEIINSDEIKHALSELPIFPGPGGLYPLSELALPGGFEDPIGITEIIDLKCLGGKREFLEQLGAKPLSFELYARDHIPRAFNTSELPPKKKRDVVQLLSSELGKIRGTIEIRRNLAALPIIECEDFLFRQPEDVYFPEEIVKTVLGKDIPLATIPPENHEAISELFEWLGVSRAPRASDVIDRINSLIEEPPNTDSIQKIVTILDHLGETYRREDEISDDFDVLKSLPWLPAKGKRDQWFCPQDIYDTFRDYLFESQADFLEVPRDVQISATGFLRWLGVKSEPETPLVINHLLRCSGQNKPVNKEVYSYLNNKTDDPAIKRLKGKACLLLPNNQYITADHVFWAEQPFGRFRYQLSSDMRKYNDLLEKLCVRDRPGPNDAIEVLLEISNHYGKHNQPLDDDAYAVCMTCWKMLSQAMETDEMSKEEIEVLSEHKVIPDDRKVLNLPHLVFFEDRAGIAVKFGDFLKHNVIPRHQGAWKAMANAGVRILSTAVDVRMLERADPVEDLLVTERVRNRKEQFARIFEPLRHSITPENALSVLEGLKYVRVKELKIQYLLRLFNRELESKPEDVPTFCHLEENTLYFVQRKRNIPWASVARELALSISPELDPGQLASGIKEVLSAESNEDAQLILDELGFAPLETTKPVAPVVTGEPVKDFGGSPTPEGSRQSSDTDDEAEKQQTEGPTTPQEAIAEIFGEGGVPPSETTHTIQTEGGASPTGREAAAQGTQRTDKIKGARKKKGKLRTYVYPEGSEYEGEPDHRASEERFAVDQAGIDHVVEYEKAHGLTPIIMPPKHPGYDIQSKDSTGKVVRYIEVKSLSSDWGMDGAALTKPQFEKAREVGDRYWLYVVERAQGENYKIHTIQNPAQRVNQFIYDDGWKIISDATLN